MRLKYFLLSLLFILISNQISLSFTLMEIADQANPKIKTIQKFVDYLKSSYSDADTNMLIKNFEKIGHLSTEYQVLQFFKEVKKNSINEKFRNLCFESNHYEQFNPYHQESSDLCFQLFLKRWEKNGLVEQSILEKIIHQDLINNSGINLKKYYQSSNKSCSSCRKLFIDKTILSLIDLKIVPHVSLLSILNPTNELTKYLSDIKYFDFTFEDRNAIVINNFYTNVWKSITPKNENETPDNRLTHHIISELTSYLKNEPPPYKTSTWLNLINLSQKLIRFNHIELATKLLDQVLSYEIPNTQFDDLVFTDLWSYTHRLDYEGAYGLIKKRNYLNNIERMTSRTHFWLALVLEQVGYIGKSQEIYKKIIEEDPVSFYAIMSSFNLEKVGTKDFHKNVLKNLDNSSLDDINLPQHIKENLERLFILSVLDEEKYIIKIKKQLHENLFSTLGTKKINKLFAYFYNKSGNHLRTFQTIISGELQDSKNFLEKLFPMPYLEIVKRHSRDRDPLIYLSLIRQESAFNPRAQSLAGAVGLMQLMPATAKSLDRKTSLKDLESPEKNIILGTKYLDQLLQKYDNSIVYALMAYNAGEGNLNKWRNGMLNHQSFIHLLESIPFSETRLYVKLILRNLFFYKYFNEGNSDSESESINQILENYSQTKH